MKKKTILFFILSAIILLLSFSFIACSNETFTISNATETRGVITSAGEYQQGKKLTLTATPYLGCNFDGWYNDNDELLSQEQSYAITVSQNVKAKFSVKPEMEMYEFNSSLTKCEITLTKRDYRGQEQIIVPSYVTDIGKWGLSDNYTTKSIILPEGLKSILQIRKALRRLLRRLHSFHSNHLCRG